MEASPVSVSDVKNFAREMYAGAKELCDAAVAHLHRLLPMGGMTCCSAVTYAGGTQR